MRDCGVVLILAEQFYLMIEGMEGALKENKTAAAALQAAGKPMFTRLCEARCAEVRIDEAFVSVTLLLHVKRCLLCLCVLDSILWGTADQPKSSKKKKSKKNKKNKSEL